MILRLSARRLTGSFVGRRRDSFASSAAQSRGRLDGKIALITGGASGLGKATAHEFIREGATVILADIDPQKGLETVRALGPQAHFLPCDVTVESQVAEAVDFAVARHGRLDVMHNSAGIAGRHLAQSIAALDLAEFDRVMAVNVRGTIIGVKHAARVMGPMGSGSILCTSSVAGLMGGLGAHPYTASKSAVLGIARSAAGELRRFGVRVNCISPFAVVTPMVVEQLGIIYKGASEEEITRIVEEVGELEGATCEGIDVAKAAVYLASDDAKYVSGHNLVVDGGFTCFKHMDLPAPDPDRTV